MNYARHKRSLVCLLTTIVLLLFSNGVSAQFDVSPTYHATLGQTTSHSPASGGGAE